MTNTIIARDLMRATQSVASVVEKSNLSTVLRATEIEFTGDTAILSGTDKSQHMRVTIPATGDPCKILIDANALDAKVRTLRADDPVTIETTDASATIKQGRTRWSMPLIAGELPTFTDVKSKPAKFSAADFTTALQLASIASPDSDARTWINGVLLDGKTMIGTNGYVLSAVPFDLGKIPRITMPTLSSRVIVRLFGKAGELAVRANENHLVIESDGIEYRTRLVGAPFPDWQTIVPTGYEHYVEFDVEHMLASIGRVTNIEQIGKDGNSVRLEVGDGEIGLSSRNIGGEMGEDFCPATISGEIPVYGALVRFITPALQSVSGKARVYFKDAGTGIKIVGTDSEGYRIVQPTRIAG